MGRLITYTAAGSNPVDYYYDGVRRLQEIQDTATTDVTDHEYVYGPDYVDEFVLETEPDGSSNCTGSA